MKIKMDELAKFYRKDEYKKKFKLKKDLCPTTVFAVKKIKYD